MKKLLAFVGTFSSAHLMHFIEANRSNFEIYLFFNNTTEEKQYLDLISEGKGKGAKLIKNTLEEKVAIDDIPEKIRHMFKNRAFLRFLGLNTATDLRTQAILQSCLLHYREYNHLLYVSELLKSEDFSDVSIVGQSYTFKIHSKARYLRNKSHRHTKKPISRAQKYLNCVINFAASVFYFLSPSPSRFVSETGDQGKTGNVYLLSNNEATASPHLSAITELLAEPIIPLGFVKTPKNKKSLHAYIKRTFMDYLVRRNLTILTPNNENAIIRSLVIHLLQAQSIQKVFLSKDANPGKSTLLVFGEELLNSLHPIIGEMKIFHLDRFCYAQRNTVCNNEMLSKLDSIFSLPCAPARNSDLVRHENQPKVSNTYVLSKGDIFAETELKDAIELTKILVKTTLQIENSPYQNIPTKEFLRDYIYSDIARSDMQLFQKLVKQPLLQTVQDVGNFSTYQEELEAFIIEKSSIEVFFIQELSREKPKKNSAIITDFKAPHLIKTIAQTSFNGTSLTQQNLHSPDLTVQQITVTEHQQLTRSLVLKFKSLPTSFEGKLSQFQADLSPRSPAVLIVGSVYNSAHENALINIFSAALQAGYSPFIIIAGKLNDAKYQQLMETAENSRKNKCGNYALIQLQELIDFGRHQDGYLKNAVKLLHQKNETEKIHETEALANPLQSLGLHSLQSSHLLQAFEISLGIEKILSVIKFEWSISLSPGVSYGRIITKATQNQNIKTFGASTVTIADSAIQIPYDSDFIGLVDSEQINFIHNAWGRQREDFLSVGYVKDKPREINQRPVTDNDLLSSSPNIFIAMQPYPITANREMLRSVFEGCQNENTNIYVKMHPREDLSHQEEYLNVAANYPNEMRFIENKDDLFDHEDKIDLLVTRTSNIGLEAALRNIPVMRYLEFDSFLPNAFLELPYAINVKDRDELVETVYTFLNDKDFRSRTAQSRIGYLKENPSLANNDGCKRIIEFMEINS